ncbi:MAG: plasmid stabilization protein [Gammaproteobacteria bacterium]|nr:plasmid stabilization protein [Gammaproteobacteria bacterium]
MKKRLEERATLNGRSIEAEIKVILHDAVGENPSSDNLAVLIRKHMAPLGGVELELPPRPVSDREPPTFD